MVRNSRLSFMTFLWARGRGKPRRQRTRLYVERLEDRSLLSSYTAGPLIQVSQDPDPLGSCDTGFHSKGNMNFSDEFETRVAVDPTNPQHLVATWVGHDLQSNFVGVSFDGGATWQENALPGITTCTGGPYPAAVDPYLLSIAPNGDIFVASVGFGAGSAILVNKSTDGGLTWTPPITIDQSKDNMVFLDKPSTTADPTNPLIAYVIFERINNGNSNSGNSTDVTYFSRTTDGGRTWEPARAIADPGNQNVNTGGKILVLPDGTLVAFFTHEENHTPSGGTFTTSLATLRSTDHGQTWLPASGPILGPEIKSINPKDPTIGATDPNTGVALNEFTAAVAFAAVDPHSGTLYAVWEDSRFSHGHYNSIAFSQSTDGGSTWSDPIQVNQTPDNIPPADQQAFRPSIAVAADGTIGVTYYDFRFNGTGPGTPTDYWFVSSRPETATKAASWKHEVGLTNSSFDLQTAPLFFRGEFVGDSNGMAAAGNDLVATWSMPTATDQGNIYFRRLIANTTGPALTSAGLSGSPIVARAPTLASGPLADAVNDAWPDFISGSFGGAGGSGGNGGNGFGGGLYNQGNSLFGTSSLTVTDSTITDNSATGGAAGNGGSAGQGIGGGVYFATGRTVCLDAFTVANIFGNTASTSNNDMFGDFTICP